MKTIRAIVVALAVAATAPVRPALADDTVDFDIPRQQADTALTSFGRQADIPVLFPYDLLSERTANELRGEYPIGEGLDILLEGTGLEATIGQGQVTVGVADNREPEPRGDEPDGFLATLRSAFTRARNEPDDSLQPAPTVLEEVLVTAERRAISLQDTPLSVAAYEAGLLEARGVETIEDIAAFTPSLDIKPSRNGGYNDPDYQIRGLAGGSGIDERSVAMYIDGVYMPRTNGPFLRLLDIERVEVLRGPQGTLFGRNSTGGAIRIFTQQPSPEPEAYVSLTGANFDRADVSAMANVPLSDALFLRMQGASMSQDGYVERGSQILGGRDETLARMQLAYEPSDALQTALGLNYFDSASSGAPRVLGTFDMRPHLDFEGNRADWVSDFLENAGEPRIEPYDDPRIVGDGFTMPDWCFLDDADPDWDAACEQINEIEYAQADFNARWTLGDVWSLASITGLSDYEFNGINDWVMLGTEARGEHIESSMLYQEIQLNADLAGGRIELVGGVSYFSEDVLQREVDRDRRSTSVYTAAGGFARGNLDAGVFRTDDTVIDQHSRSIGVFTNVTWHASDRLRLTPGLRWSTDTKSVTATEFASDDFEPVPVDGDATTIFVEQDWTRTDWRFTLAYDVTPEHMLYATASRAFRAGTYVYPIRDDFSGAAQTEALALSPPFLDPESVRNTEIGVRSEWLDRRLRLNVTLYDMKYTNRQGPIQQLDPESPTGYVTRTQNTGDVDLSGIEIEGRLHATDTFTLNFAAGTVNPDVLQPCRNNGDFLFPGPAEATASIGGRWALASGIDASLSYEWSGEKQTHPGGTDPVANDCATEVPGWFFDSRYEQPAYGVWNGRVRFGGHPAWTVTLFVNNLTDQYVSPYSGRSGGGFWDAANPAGVGAPPRSARSDNVGRPREYGITFRYNFGGARTGS